MEGWKGGRVEEGKGGREEGRVEEKREGWKIRGKGGRGGGWKRDQDYKITGLYQDKTKIRGMGGRVEDKRERWRIRGEEKREEWKRGRVEEGGGM